MSTGSSTTGGTSNAAPSFADHQFIPNDHVPWQNSQQAVSNLASNEYNMSHPGFLDAWNGVDSARLEDLDPAGSTSSLSPLANLPYTTWPSNGPASTPHPQIAGESYQQQHTSPFPSSQAAIDSSSTPQWRGVGDQRSATPRKGSLPPVAPKHDISMPSYSSKPGRKQTEQAESWQDPNTYWQQPPPCHAEHCQGPHSSSYAASGTNVGHCRSCGQSFGGMSSPHPSTPSQRSQSTHSGSSTRYTTPSAPETLSLTTARSNPGPVEYGPRHSSGRKHNESYVYYAN